MRSLIVWFVVFGLFLGACKEKEKDTKSKTIAAEQEVITKKPVSPIIKEMAEFANIRFFDSITANQIFSCKEIDNDGFIKTIDKEKAIYLYNVLLKHERAISWPIFEIKEADTAILVVEGIGFGGAIWAKVLVDRNSLEIKKIEFGHKAESDGYGKSMTQSSFENKFIGTIIDVDKNTFTLQKNLEKRIDDGKVIDGITGATMTSKAVIDMLNLGFKKYRAYLIPNT